jgi:hypothetical protein
MEPEKFRAVTAMIPAFLPDECETVQYISKISTDLFPPKLCCLYNR